MSDQNSRDRGPYADDSAAGHHAPAREAIPYDAPYRTQRPSDDFSNSNPRRDYNPYAAEENGFGRSYETPYDQDDKRGLVDRAADEVASWLGDRNAQGRRDEDHRG